MIDFSKPVQTREGLKVVIKFTDGPGEFPVYGLMTYEDGLVSVEDWTEDGRFYYGSTESKYDLVQAPETKTFYSVSYRLPSGDIDLGSAYDAIEAAQEDYATYYDDPTYKAIDIHEITIEI